MSERGTLALENVDLSSFNTAQVRKMSSMFADAGLISVGLSPFDTSQVTNMSGVFLHFALSQIRLGEKFRFIGNDIGFLDLIDRNTSSELVKCWIKVTANEGHAPKQILEGCSIKDFQQASMFLCLIWKQVKSTY
ncbi:BspA family leucine-rich repeat surface protein [Enterococcus faecalis]